MFTTESQNTLIGGKWTYRAKLKNIFCPIGWFLHSRKQIIQSKMSTQSHIELYVRPEWCVSWFQITNLSGKFWSVEAKWWICLPWQVCSEWLAFWNVEISLSGQKYAMFLLWRFILPQLVYFGIQQKHLTEEDWKLGAIVYSSQMEWPPPFPCVSTSEVRRK